jgi:hypothetical protein
MALAAMGWRRSIDAGLAVLAGGLLAWLSYRGIKAGIDAALRRSEGRGDHGGGRGRGLALVKFFTRYAIVALAAYIGMVRLRLHPVGLVVGASSFVVAAAMEAIRSARTPSRPGNPR